MLKLLSLPMAVCLVALLGGTASADGELVPVGGTPDQLRTRNFVFDPLTGHSTPSTCSDQVWRATQDSPLDTNNHALLATMCTSDYGIAYSDRSRGGLGPLDQVQNLSFDYLTSSIARLRQVRIEVSLSTGDELHLDPRTCSRPLPPTSGTYRRADFTGTTAAGSCSVRDSSGTVFTSNGTRSAVQVYADAHPGVAASSTLIRFSNTGAATVMYNVDRIALGSGWLYNYSKLRAVTCTGEAAC